MAKRSGTDDGAAQEAVSGDLRVTSRLTIPAAALQWRFSRASGPGGQGVNTTDSRVELTVDLLGLDALTPEQLARAADVLGNRLTEGGTLTLVASEHRSQLRNREAARGRLAALLQSALAAPPKQRRDTKPTRGSRRRRLEAKKQRGQTKSLRQKPEH